MSADTTKVTLERACRRCGCTNDRACIDPRDGLPCHWIEPDLCSACRPRPPATTPTAANR